MSSPRKHDYDQIRSDRRSGMSRKAIAEKHGCAQHTIQSAIASDPAHGAQDCMDSEISVILTASFRKVMGYCPLADGPQGEVAL